MGKLMELIGVIVFSGVVFYGLYYLFLTSTRKRLKVEETYTREEIEKILKRFKDHQTKYDDKL